MNPRKFTAMAEKAGLCLRGLSLAAVSVLQALARAPMPRHALEVVDRRSTVGLRLGPIIRHRLARFDGEADAYVITEVGREYLAKLEAAGLLGKGVAA